MRFTWTAIDDWTGETVGYGQDRDAVIAMASLHANATGNTVRIVTRSGKIAKTVKPDTDRGI